MTQEGARLDPQDWEEFDAAFHQLASECLRRMKDARDLPWIPPDAGFPDRVALTDVATPTAIPALFAELAQSIMPYATGNTHPRFFGWVHGTGLPAAVAAEMVAATMNANCGGRHHGAIEVERAVIRWLLDLAGLPKTGSGILTTGTSQATILAFSAARTQLFGPDVRKLGVRAFPEVAVYAADGAHSCISKAMELLGYGAHAVRRVPLNSDGGMDLALLAKAVQSDRAHDIQPLAIVATLGAVNTGVFDPLSQIAEFCETEGIWLHADAAFGFWTLLADAPWSGLCAGIDRVDSLACDFHKWMAVPYDAAACLIRDQELHYRTFADRPEYLAPQQAGLGGGDHWFCDYGVELSRGFRALKVWATVRAAGTKALGAAISDNCRQARHMGQLAAASPHLTLMQPVVSNICCIGTPGHDPAEIAADLQLSGEVVFSTTHLTNGACLRAAIVNHRTTSRDILRAIEAVENKIRAAG